jgi:hypothetical protein
MPAYNADHGAQAVHVHAPIFSPAPPPQSGADIYVEHIQQQLIAAQRHPVRNMRPPAEKAQLAPPVASA